MERIPASGTPSWFPSGTSKLGKVYLLAGERGEPRRGELSGSQPLAGAARTSGLVPAVQGDRRLADGKKVGAKYEESPGLHM